MLKNSGRGKKHLQIEPWAGIRYEQYQAVTFRQTLSFRRSKSNDEFFRSLLDPPLSERVQFLLFRQGSSFIWRPTTGARLPQPPTRSGKPTRTIHQGWIKAPQAAIKIEITIKEQDAGAFKTGR
jgi:hypothetical protein